MTSPPTNLAPGVDTTPFIRSLHVVSTPGARFVGGDVKDFYLNTPLKRKRYEKVRAKYIPEETIRKHDLEQYIEGDGWIHF